MGRSKAAGTMGTLRVKKVGEEAEAVEDLVSTESRVSNARSSGARSPLSTVSEREDEFPMEEVSFLIKSLRRDYDRHERGEDHLQLTFLLDCARNVRTRGVRGDRYFVRIHVLDENGQERDVPIRTQMATAKNGFPNFDFLVILDNVCSTDVLRFTLVLSNLNFLRRVGTTIISVADLAKHDHMEELYLFSRSGIAVFDRKLENPTTLRLRAISQKPVGDNRPALQRAMSVVTRHGYTADGRSLDEKELELEKQLLETRSSRLAEVHIGGVDAAGALIDLSNVKSIDTVAANIEVKKEEDEEMELDEDDFVNGSGVEQDSDSSLLAVVETEGEEDDEKKEEQSEIPGSVLQPSGPSADIKGSSVEAELKELVNEPVKIEPGAKHVLVITRGTRGDVQPFLALGRGLAELRGWTVTICTEIRYKELVKKYSKVERGNIRFVPSGGDTEARIAKPIAKWAVHTKLRIMQAAMLGRMEREFFDSEPALFYACSKLRPDLLCYTFTTTNLAFIVSEALKIPIVGFFLQPTCLPSKHYTPITPLRKLDEIDEQEVKSGDIEGHKTFRRVKYFMENNPFTTRLDEMYRRRGIHRNMGNRNDFEVIVDKKYPLVIPIKPAAFGGKPDDWPDSARMTDFIFLRSSSVPELTDAVQAFISQASSHDFKLMCICFSSMPVSRIRIIESALHILEGCPEPHKPAIIALIGNRPEDEQRNPRQEERAERFIAGGRLLIIDGAPFSKLFPKLDFLVIHGGLGTTAEALASGVPCMVTGVLLLDQRFWGTRVHALGVGPRPVHISDFNSSILKVLPDAFDPEGEWSKRAKQVQAEMFPGGIENMGDGVAANVEAFVEASEAAFSAPGRPLSNR